MKLPLYLRDFEKEIAEAQENLGSYCDASILDWLRNFKREELPYVVPLLQNFEYVTEAEVRATCQRMHFDILKVIGSDPKYCLVGLGPAGKSGQAILYHYRNASNIEEERCFFETEIDKALQQGFRKFIFLDDIVGSGSQAIRLLTKVRKEYFNRMGHGGVEIFYLSLVATKKGINSIKEATGIKVHANLVYRESDKAFLSRHIYKDTSSAEKGREICENHGKYLFSQHPLGYQEGQMLISFFYNTPNNTLPIFWSTAGGWKPLFRRMESPPKSSRDKRKSRLAVSISNSNSYIASAAIKRFFTDSLSSRKVYWVDDNHSNNKLELQILNDIGIKVAKFSSAPSLFKYVKKHGDPFVLISDLRRPSSPTAGIDLASKLVQAGAKFPILIYSYSAADYSSSIPARVHIARSPEDLISNVVAGLILAIGRLDYARQE